MSKQSVVLPDSLVAEIQSVAIEIGSPVKGAIQKALLHGAKLALEDWKSKPTVNGKPRVLSTATVIPSTSLLNTNHLEGDINLNRPEISESELPWVNGLLRNLRGKNELAKVAIKTNILAFVDYSENVPEVTGAFSDIDALEDELQRLDQQLVDEREKNNVVRVAGKQKVGHRFKKPSR